MTDGDAPGARQADIVSLPTLDPDTRAILHQPTGLLIISRGGFCVSGSREDLVQLAAEITAACWEARGLSGSYVPIEVSAIHALT